MRFSPRSNIAPFVENYNTLMTNSTKCGVEIERSDLLIVANRDRRDAADHYYSEHATSSWPAPVGIEDTNGSHFPGPSGPNALLNCVPVPLREHPVYAYIVTTIKTTTDYRLVQEGSAPNFHGRRITLCTCKHKDRATFHLSRDGNDPWRNVWVAGLTSKLENPSRSLAYLMLVERSFANHLELWRALPNNCRSAKAASKSQLGDLFEPTVRAAKDPHDPANYKCPIRGHVHSSAKYPNTWHHDVRRWGRRAKPHRLLLGEAAQSYRWSEVKIILKVNAMGRSAHHRLFESLNAFIANLQEFDV
jgi:hypothetical protein